MNTADLRTDHREARFDDATPRSRDASDAISRPAHRAEVLHFPQGRRSRLHEPDRYRRNAGHPTARMVERQAS